MLFRSSNIIVNGKKSIGEIAKSAKKYSTFENNSLYTFKNSPFDGNGNYGVDVSENNAFEALPTQEMGRTYVLK